MKQARRTIPPALVLFLLAPAIGELLSGSAPPVEFFRPLSLLVLTALYGGGALLARELALRWDKRWPTILLLGVAYGILEEGLMVKSFFDPAWMDLGVLGVYGRWAGVNWVWAVLLTIYHAVFSISLPILLVELMYPGRRDERWLSRRGMLSIALLLAADVVFGFTLLTPYRPPLAPYALTVLLTIALVVLARELPPRWSPAHPKPRWRPAALWLLGLLSTGTLFFGGWVLPALNLPPLLSIAVMLGGAWSVLRLVRRASGESAWDDLGRLALASGALSFFILLALGAEHNAGRTDNPAGMGLVGLVAAGGLLLLYLKLRHQAGSRSTAPGPAGDTTAV